MLLALRRPGSRRFLALVLGLVALAVVLVGRSRPAQAYAWMIRHDYSGCVPCHADPSGGGVLTRYGRALSEQVLRTRYGAPGGSGENETPSKLSRFLGFVDTPEWLLAGGSVRALALRSAVADYPAQSDAFLMQADLRAQVTLGRFRAGGSAGYSPQGGLPAALVVLDDKAQENSIVSREHWLGVDLGEDSAWLLRAGRINVPFGIRQPEHTLWTRTSTRSDLDSTQQHGVALSYVDEKKRGELLGIAGNYQVSPDVFRERGYSGFGEYMVLPQLALGASSRLTRASQDLDTQAKGSLRGAHGLFARAAPHRAVGLLSEADLVTYRPSSSPTTLGHAAFFQADWEVYGGVHALGTLQTRRRDWSGGSSDWGGWLSAAWFLAPHTDLRLDAIQQWIAQSGGGHARSFTLLAQAHLYL